MKETYRIFLIKTCIHLLNLLKPDKLFKDRYIIPNVPSQLRDRHHLMTISIGKLNTKIHFICHLIITYINIPYQFLQLTQMINLKMLRNSIFNSLYIFIIYIVYISICTYIEMWCFHRLAKYQATSWIYIHRICIQHSYSIIENMEESATCYT